MGWNLSQRDTKVFPSWLGCLGGIHYPEKNPYPAFPKYPRLFFSPIFFSHLSFFIPCLQGYGPEINFSNWYRIIFLKILKVTLLVLLVDQNENFTQNHSQVSKVGNKALKFQWQKNQLVRIEWVNLKGRDWTNGRDREGGIKKIGGIKRAGLGIFFQDSRISPAALRLCFNRLISHYVDIEKSFRSFR